MYFLIIGLAVLLNVSIGMADTRPSLSSYQLIQNAYGEGRFSYEQKLLYEVQSIKDQDALPAEFQSEAFEVGKCATEIFLEAHRNWELFTPEQQTLLRGYFARPSRAFSYVSPGGKFRIHYDVSGTHAVPTADVNPANGIPDFIDWLASYADSSYRTQVTYLGHREPPSDGTAGGDSRYDIYTENMGYYGYAQPEGPGPEPWNDAYSYVSVHRNFIGFPPNTDPEGNQKGAAKVTVAHEYYHAVQFAYDYTEQLWFMEASSTWMEDWNFDPVNDNYNYLSDIFNNPDWALHSTSSLHPYAAFVWPKYLEENYGAVIMRDIWEQLISTTPYPGTSNELALRGKSLNPEVSRFWMWCYITGARNDGQHFTEASNYPLISVARTHSTYPVTNQGPLTGKAPDAMGANYIVFNVPGGAQSLTVEFNGDNSTPWIVRLLARYAPGVQYDEFQMSLDGLGDGSFTLDPASSYSSLIMVICNVSQSLNDRQYVYNASYQTIPTAAVQVTTVADDTVYSNTSGAVMFEVENRGSSTDQFNLSAVDQLGWTMSVVPPSVNLAYGQTAQVTVNLTCPPLTPGGTANQIELTASANSTMGVTDVDTADVLVLLMHGDADNSGLITISDATYIISYIFSSGATPVPDLLAGDADCNSLVTISDATYIITYIFSGGPPPPCNPI